MERETLLFLAVAGSIVMFVGSLILLPIVVIKLPVDFFLTKRKRLEFLDQRHPAMRYAMLIVKNLIGSLLLLAGLAMLVTPGQGVLAILAGIALLDIPGKRSLELWIVGQPTVQRAMNSIRRRARKDPLQMPPTNQGEGWTP